MGGTLKILDLISEDENLEVFKVRLAHLKHLALIDLKEIKRAYEPAIREIGLSTWDNFSDENKVQLTMIKFLSLEERISGSQPPSQKENVGQASAIDSLIEQFELFRFEAQQQMDQMQRKISALADENKELRDRLDQ
jgi:predicted RNase H-like nuclease (RuvC/YqgF family)